MKIALCAIVVLVAVNTFVHCEPEPLLFGSGGGLFGGLLGGVGSVIGGVVDGAANVVGGVVTGATSIVGGLVSGVLCLVGAVLTFVTGLLSIAASCIISVFQCLLPCRMVVKETCVKYRPSMKNVYQHLNLAPFNANMQYFQQQAQYNKQVFTDLLNEITPKFVSYNLWLKNIILNYYSVAATNYCCIKTRPSFQRCYVHLLV